MSAAEILESLDRHFLVGCPGINEEQLKSHHRDGACFECIARASSLPMTKAADLAH